MNASNAPRRAHERIDWAQVRLIFVTNWRTWLNRWSNKPLRLILNALLLAMFACFAAGGSVALALGVDWLKGQNPAAAVAAVHLTFLLVMIVIIVTPMVGFRGNEFLDVTKLFNLPVGHRTVFVATLCCLMGSFSVFILSLPIVAVTVGFGWSGPPGAIVGGVAAGLLMVVVAVAAGQFLLLLSLNTLKSRKWRDLSTILVALVGGSGLAIQFLMRSNAFNRGNVIAGLQRFDAWKNWTLPLPSWWAANAATGTDLPRFLPALAMIGVVAWLVRAAAVLEERAFLGEVEADTTVEAATRRGPIGRLATLLRDPLGALVEKDLSLIRREPVVRSLLINGAMFPAMYLVLGAASLRGRDLHALARYVPLVGLLAYPLLLMEMGLVMNLLGVEGGGAVHSLLLPVRRRTLLLGKDVAYLLSFGTLNAAIVVALTAASWIVTGAGGVVGCVGLCLLGALESYAALAVGLSIGNLLSVVLPIRLAVRDRRAIRQQMTGRDGCARSLLGLASVFGTMALSVPVAALFHGAYLSRQISWVTPLPAWTAVLTAPAALVIAFAAMYGGATLGGGWLAAREEEVATRLSKSEE